MKQYGASEEEAYTELHRQIAESWKDINEELLEPMAVPMPLFTCPLNLVRFMHVFYKGKDNFTHSQGLMKDMVTSIFVDSIPM